MQITNDKVLRDQYGTNIGCENFCFGQYDEGAFGNGLEEWIWFPFSQQNSRQWEQYVQKVGRGNSKLSGNEEVLDQRFSEGHLWRKKWIIDFQPGMIPSMVTEIRQSLNPNNPSGVHSQVDHSDLGIDNLSTKWLWKYRKKNTHRSWLPQVYRGLIH